MTVFTRTCGLWRPEPAISPVCWVVRNVGNPVKVDAEEEEGETWEKFALFQVDIKRPFCCHFSVFCYALNINGSLTPLFLYLLNQISVKLFRTLFF